jgi:hypothetical protein
MQTPPAEQLCVLATHVIGPVSQHAVPAHMFPEQHAWPGLPQAEQTFELSQANPEPVQVPPAQHGPFGMPHVRHCPLLQVDPSVHWPPGQQGCPTVPHCWFLHIPFWQLRPTQHEAPQLQSPPCWTQRVHVPVQSQVLQQSLFEEHCVPPTPQLAPLSPPSSPASRPPISCWSEGARSEHAGANATQPSHARPKPHRPSCRPIQLNGTTAEPSKK